jgi:thiol-disulfide isomerase/thioredoxin
MTRKNAMRMLAAFGALLMTTVATMAGAEVTGQQRAEAAGQELVGKPAPRVVLKTIDGERIDLASLYGKKAVYLKFWATWCTPCREQMPHFEHVYQSAGADLAVVAIDVGFNDSVEEVLKYRKKLGITMPIVFDDGSLGAAFRLRVTPQHIVIGRDGRIQYVGHLADARLDGALRAAREPGGAPATAGNAPGPVRAEGAPIGIGDTLPAQALTTLDGKSFALKGNGATLPTVLVFLSPWCESYLATTRPAIAANCRRGRLQVQELSKDQHVRWLGIASGLWANSEELRAYQAENKIGIPLTLDESGALFRAFRVTDVPTVLIANADGKLTQRINADDPQGLRKAVAGL